MTEKGAYARAGVDIAAAKKANKLMAAAVRATFGPEVLSDLGAFGAMFDGGRLKAMAAPLLVSSTDGVGTKTKVASRMGRWDTVGQDLVNHCINDILVQGARPLFFLDYVASSKLDPNVIATIVTGAATACKVAGCALIGGETAEMPGVYQDGEVDLVGTIVGAVDRAHLIDGKTIRAGDVVLGLPSSGLHTNGYTLAQSILGELDWDAPNARLGSSIGEALLAVHRSYLKPVEQLLEAGLDIRGLSHITGGGLLDNPPRILPPGTRLRLERDTWPEPPLFGLLRELGAVPDDEMRHVFNVGLGMLVVLPAEQANAATSTLSGDAYRVGEILSGEGVVEFA